MRKGDETKQTILRAAEQLFCQRGYEAASMQEIVQLSGISKGGIYHHFTSKEEIMTHLCQQQAQQAAAATQAQVSDTTDALTQLNLLLTGCLPLKETDLPFTAMLLPLMASSQGRALALTYLDARQTAFLPLVEDVVHAGCHSDLLFTEIRGIESVILHLLTDCFLDITALLLSCHQEKQPCDTSALLGVLTRYRRSVEVLLNAPYGAITLFPLETLEKVAQRLMNALS